MADTEYTLHYWGIRARNWAALTIAHYGGVKVNWKKDTGADFYKVHSPFGQLPLLTGPDGFALGQSMAITRFLSRKAGLQGDSDADFARSELLLEEATDLFTAVAKAHYGANRKADMDKVFGEVLPQHYAALEKLFIGETLSGKVLAGDLVIGSFLNIAGKLQADHLDNFPKLKAFYEKLAGDAKISPLWGDETIGMYFERQ